MIRSFTFSEAGGHPVNEDAFIARQIAGDAEGWVVCVADGQGGRSGGARASRLACDTIAEGLSSLRDMLHRAGRILDLARRLRGDELLTALQAAARLPGSGQLRDDFTVVMLESANPC